PPPNAAAHPNDIFRPENVRGFAQDDQAILVFMGLDHGAATSGRIFRVVQSGNAWALESFGVLDASPAAWIKDNGRMLVLTESGLWQAAIKGPPRKLHDLDI